MRPVLSTALLGFSLLAGAALFDAEPLYVPAVTLLTLAGGAVAWVVLSARGVTVTRTVSARRVVEDEAVAIVVTVRGGRLPAPTGLVDEPLLPEPARLGFGRDATTVRIRATFARRGRRVLAPPRVIVRDPLGLATRVVSAREDDEVLVLPKVLPVVAAAGPGEGNAAGRRSRPRAAAEIDLDGVRPHRPGSPASRIYWPALARGAELMERRLQAEADTRPLIVLDPRGAARPEDLDAAVRAVASLAVHLARRGGCAVLLPGDRRPTSLDPSLAGWAHLHARLAVSGGEGRPALAGAAGRPGVVLYVAARVLTRPPRSLAHHPGAGRVLVVPGALPGRRSLFAVAGCHGYEFGVRVGAHAHATRTVTAA